MDINQKTNLDNIQQDANALKDQENAQVVINSETWNIVNENADQQAEDYQETDLINGDLRIIWTDLGEKTKKKNNRILYLALILVIIVITSAIGFLSYKYDKYIIDYWNWIEIGNEIYNKFEELKGKIYKLLWKEYAWIKSQIELSNENWTSNLKWLIEWDNSYIYKKETLKSSVQNLFNSVISSANKIDETKKYISSYWFFSDKLSSIISDDEAITSIQESLTAIESIKFSSAISVFSKLDTFLESTSRETWLEKEEILEKMKNISKRWEKDINLYIKNCKLNASELDYQCNHIWDFDKYYELTEDTWFDTKFFKALMEFIDAKLEQTDIPSFSIKFKSFDKANKEMSFDVEINTFKEDEVELAKNWILSPHSFILNSLINNLRLSRVIISEWIKVESIKVNQVTKTFWTTEFIINSSNHSFTVPIKKENQIEIDDFSY